MRCSAVISVLVFVVACGKKQPPPPNNEFEAFERKFVAENQLLAEALRKQGREIADKDIPTSYRAVFIGPSGVFVDSKLVATLPELETKRAAIVAAHLDHSRAAERRRGRRPLKEHKASAFFADRTDLELGSGAGTSGDVIKAFEIACNAGFLDVTVLERGQLSAVPQP